MLLTQILADSAQKYGPLPALTMRMGYRTITLTYTQVEELAKKVALFLEEKNVGKGDKVLLCGPNSPYWICIWWGCVLRGCIVVPLAPQNTQTTMEKIARQTEAKLFFKSIAIRQAIPDVPVIILEQVPVLVKNYNTSCFVPAQLSQDDCVEIMYTSGTTGDPKGVVLTHNNIASNVMAIRDILSMRACQERLLSILPLSHMFEQTIGFLLPFSGGAHIIYAYSHAAIRELLKKYKITKIVAVPEFLKLLAARIKNRVHEKGRENIFNRLLRISKKISWKPFQRIIFWPIHNSFGGHLDTIASGGAPLDPELEQFWDDVGLYVMQGYGLTETSPVLTSNTFKYKKIGSVGKPLANTHVRLVNDGEIEARGPGVFTGYFKNPEKTAESFTPDNYFKTGDMGYFDPEGFLYLKGRKKYMIKGPGAENIFPEDVELALGEVPGVKDSCVIGIEKSSGMVEIHAVLLLDPEIRNTPENIIKQANSKLAPYQYITGWSVWPEEDFPRSVTRKIKKELVIAWVHDRGNQAVIQNNGVAEGQLAGLLAQISGVSPSSIHKSTRLEQDLKLDSLMRVELVTGIEEMRGVIIDERLLTESTTVHDLENIIDQAQPVTKMPLVKNWPRAWWARIIRSGGRVLLYGITRLFFRLKIEGLENLEELKTPVIFMPNHVSLLDALIVMVALPKNITKNISFAAAYDVLYKDYKYVGWLAELFFNAFPFPRKEHEHIGSGLVNMGIELDAGYSVVVFPEGQLSPTGNLQPLKRGAGLIALEMGVPIVPVKLKGLWELVPFDTFIPSKRGEVTITFGKPLLFSHEISYDQVTKLIKKSLENL